MFFSKCVLHPRVPYNYESIDGVEPVEYWCLSFDGPNFGNFIPLGWPHLDELDQSTNLLSILEIVKNIYLKEYVYGIHETPKIFMMADRKITKLIHYSILKVELPVIHKVVFVHGYNNTSAYRQASLRLWTEYRRFYRYISICGIDYGINQLDWQKDLFHMCQHKIKFIHFCPDYHKQNREDQRKKKSIKRAERIKNSKLNLQPS